MDEIFGALNTKQREPYRQGFNQALTAAANKVFETSAICEECKGS